MDIRLLVEIIGGALIAGMAYWFGYADGEEDEYEENIRKEHGIKGEKK